ncbi:MAG: ComEC/Rec2 family competence protein [Candidatus Anammoxibacter sp.]
MLKTKNIICIYYTLFFIFGVCDATTASTSDKLRIHIMDMGEADSIIIQSPCDEKGRDKIMVVDVGEDRGRSGIEAELVYSYIKKVLRKNVIDYVMLTNYNEEHIGWPREKRPTGVFYLLDKSNIQIKKVIDRGLEIDSNSPLDNKYREWISKRRIPRETVRWSYSTGIGKGQIKLGRNIYIDIIAFNTIYDKKHNYMAIPEKDVQVKSNENNFSIVFVLHYRRFEMYFGSDIPGYKNTNQQLVNISERFIDRLKRVEVCKVSDHGSNKSTRNDILQALMPKTSIISCGKGNENPHPQLLIRLLGYSDKKTGNPIGSDIYQTSMGDGWKMTKPFETSGKTHTIVNGNITIETDGKDEFSIIYVEDGEEIKKNYSIH